MVRVVWAKTQGRGISVQPKSIAVAALAATLTVGSVVQGAPFFTSREAAPPASRAEGDGGWKFPSLWRSKPTESQLAYQAPEPKRSASSRVLGVFTDNPLTRAFDKEDNTPQFTNPAPQYNPLSLEHPVTDPTPELLLSTAQITEAQGNIDQARALYNQAIAAHPREVKCYREAGHFEDRQGKLAEAETHYRRAMLIDPNDAAVVNDLALCLARQGQLPQSAELLSRAIKMNPQKSLYRNNMATVLMEMGDQQGALQQLLAAHPPAVAHYNMGHLLEKGGQTAVAASYYAEAARLDPSLAAVREALARVSVAPPVVATNTTSVPVRTPGPQTSQPHQYVGAPTQPPHHSNYGGAPQQGVVPQVVAPLPTVNQAPASQVWPVETQNTTPQPYEPSFGPRLLPPAR